MRLYFSGICFSPSETNKPLTYVADSLILASVGHETPASPFVFRFCVGEFSFVYRLDPCENQFGPGREGLGRGPGVGPAGQDAVQTGQAFLVAYRPFLWVGSLFADPGLRCSGGFGVLAPE